MKPATWLLIALVCGVVQAAKIDMSDPRRAVATSDGIRIDAELTSDAVSPGLPIAIRYRIENSSPRPIAVAEKRCETEYDAESRTLTLSVGLEIPIAGQMPRLAIVQSGQKRTLVAAASFTGPVVPRYVQIRVNLLRDVTPFLAIAEHQRLDDAQFDRWIDSNESIELNAVPVHYRPALMTRNDASHR
jgi:hypothetical protein